MESAVDRLRKYQSSTPSKWREEAEWRHANRAWLRRSQTVAVKMLNRMEEMHWTQAQVAGMLGCSQQYVSRIVKGSENLTLEMLSKIEDALGVDIFGLDINRPNLFDH
jgi:antitoxin component HigA of HigAB toxin-antitoxin module